MTFETPKTPPEQQIPAPQTGDSLQSDVETATLQDVARECRQVCGDKEAAKARMVRILETNERLLERQFYQILVDVSSLHVEQIIGAERSCVARSSERSPYIPEKHTALKIKAEAYVELIGLHAYPIAGKALGMCFPAELRRAATHMDRTGTTMKWRARWIAMVAHTAEQATPRGKRLKIMDVVSPKKCQELEQKAKRTTKEGNQS